MSPSLGLLFSTKPKPGVRLHCWGLCMVRHSADLSTYRLVGGPAMAMSEARKPKPRTNPIITSLATWVMGRQDAANKALERNFLLLDAPHMRIGLRLLLVGQAEGQ